MSFVATTLFQQAGSLAKSVWRRGLAICRTRDLSVVTSGVFLRSLAAFAFAKLAAAWLGPVEYATYGHYYMVATYLVTASSLGLGNAFTVYIARSRSRAESLSSEVQAVTTFGVSTGLVAALGLMALFFLDPHGVLLPRIRGWNLSYWFLFCLVAALGASIQSVLLGKEQHVRYQLVTALNPLASCVALVTVYLLGGVNPTLAIITYMIGFLVPIAAFPSFVRMIVHVRWDAFNHLIRFSRSYLIPSLLIPTVGTLSILSVRHVVSIWVTTYDLGLWQALWRISEGYMGALISVGTALFLPRFSQIRTQSEAFKRLSKAAAMLLAIYSPLALAFLFIPGLALRLLLSAQFSPLASLLPVEICGDALKILCFLLELFFMCMLAPRLALLAEVMFSGIFLGLAPLLLSHTKGPVGAVWAYTISYAIVLSILIQLAYRRIRALPMVEATT